MRKAKKCPACGSDAFTGHSGILAPFISAIVWGYEPAEITEANGLRDIAPGVSYVPCNTDICMDCGTVFADTRFDPIEEASIYAYYRSFPYCAIREKYEPGYTERNQKLIEGAGGVDYVRSIERFIGETPIPCSILDWGGDTGRDTPFREYCEKPAITIYDVNKSSPLAGCFKVDNVEELRKYNFDHIVLSNVLEHVAKPCRMLKEVKEFMNENTYLFIEVPSEWDPEKVLWHEHVTCFSEEGLRLCVERAGLSVLKSEEVTTEWEGKPKKFYRILCERA